MATFAGLSQTFNKAVEAAIRWTPSPQPAPAGGPPLHSNRKNLQNELSNSNQLFCNQINDLVAQDRAARQEIMQLLKKRMPTQEQLNSLKKEFDKHNKELRSQLQKIHEAQYEKFELTMEHNSGFSVPERFNLLAKLTSAQQAQLAAFDERSAYDQQRLDKVTDWETQRDQKFAAYVLGLAEEKKEAIGKHDRLSLYANVKKRFMSEEDREEYDVMGEVEIKRAKKFSPTKDLEQDQDGRWRPKEILKEAQKKERQEGGDGFAVRRKKSAEWEDEWAILAGDYLGDKTEIRLSDLPAAGIYEHILPLKLMEGRLIDKQELVIKIGVPVEANKKKDIPPTDSAISCKLSLHANAEEKAVALNAIMYTARAKGWEDIEIGYDTPKEMWHDAYLAARRAGFTHEQILFRGGLMSDKGLKERGNDAREKINKAFEAKLADDEKKEEEAAHSQGKQLRNMDYVIKKLTNATPYNPNLDTTKFFDLTPAEQKDLFPLGTLKQQAKIIADYAFDETLFDINNDSPLRRAVFNQEPILLAELLDLISLDNPERAFLVFDNVDAQDKEEVFANLDNVTAAQLLMQLSEQERSNLFKDSFTNITNNENFEPTKKALILKEPVLSDEVIYALFDTGVVGQSNEDKVLKILATEPVDENSVRALGVIIAGSFSNYPDQATAAERLRVAWKELSAEKKEAVVSEIYRALPVDKRMSMPGASNANFLDYIQNYGRETHRTTFAADVRDLYKEADQALKGNDAIIKNELEFLNSVNPAHTRELKTKNTNHLYARVTPESIAHNLMKFNDPKIILSRLIEHTTPQYYSQLAKVIAETNFNLTKLDDFATLLNQLIERIELAEPAHYSGLVDIVATLGPGAVGKALMKLYNDGDDPNVEKLSIILRTKGEYQLFANIVEVCYQIDKNDLTLVNDFIDHDHPINVTNVVGIIPYIKNSALITKLMEDRNGLELVFILGSHNLNEADQIKIFKNLTGDQQWEIYREYYPDNLIKEQKFFEYLKGDRQKVYIEVLLQDIENNSQNNPANSTRYADQIIACLSNPHLSAPQRADLAAAMTNDSYQLVLEHASRPTERFLKDYLKVAQQGQQGTLENAFHDMVNKDPEMFLLLGKAVTSLDEAVQTKLLVVELGQHTSDHAASVQASALIQLVNKGDKEQAKKLFEKIGEMADPTQNTQVADKIKALMTNYPDALKQELTQLIAPSQPPAPVPQA